jgi:hypothetical protein
MEDVCDLQLLAAHGPLGVDVADPERDHLGDAQAGAVGGGECRLVLRPRCGLQQQHDLLDA